MVRLVILIGSACLSVFDNLQHQFDLEFGVLIFILFYFIGYLGNYEYDMSICANLEI